jgi:O-antigen/teichoic acid export membrane protein
MIGTVTYPLDSILLPKISNMIAQGREKEIKESLNFLIGAIIQCSIFLCIQLMIFANVIVKYWLGSEFLEALPVMRIIFLSILFYIFYVVIRSVLDAAKVKPLNTINLFISLVVYLIIGGILLVMKFFSPIISLSIAFTFGFICLGFLSYISIRKIYSVNLSEDIRSLSIALIVNILLGALAVLLKSFIALKFYYLLLFIVTIGVIYFLTLWSLKVKWIRQIPRVVFRNYV